MKAVICPTYGPPEVLELKEIEKPVPNDNEVLVKVHATTVNRTDCAILRAQPFIMRFIYGFLKPKLSTPGTDFAGMIETVGKNVSSFKVGDRVFGFDDMGLSSHAEYLTISDNNAFGLIPDNITYEQAAASIEGVHYARNFLNKVNIKPDQKILVNGATGAIGSAAVQLLNNHDVEVTAVCNIKDADLVKSLGAKKVIDYVTDDFTKSNEKYSFVFDTVGKSTFGKCRPLLDPGGVYISSELGPMAQNPILAAITPIFGGRRVKFPLPIDRHKSVNDIKKLIEEGKYQAVIERTYSLNEAVEAFTYVEKGQKVGNVVIKVEHKSGTE